MRHKMKVFLLLSLGIWTKEVRDAFELNTLAKVYDNDPEDGLTNYQQIMETIGVSHSLLWQYLPLGTWVAKLSEHINSPPCFVRDSEDNKNPISMDDDNQTRLWTLLMNITDYVMTLLIALSIKPAALWFLISAGLAVIKRLEVDLRWDLVDWFLSSLLWTVAGVLRLPGRSRPPAPEV